MKIVDKKINFIINNPKVKSKFIFSTLKELNLNCNFLTQNFYLDSHNYFPLTEDFYSFAELFRWGDNLKYSNFYSENFNKKFSKNLKEFKNISNVIVLGSSSFDNYYRNMMTFLPRIFFIKEKKIKLAIHRNSSNKFRNFIRKICHLLNIKIQFVFLDDGFYKFTNSQIPQFLKKTDSLTIINSLKRNNNSIKEKIYVSRLNCNYRNLINESDIIEKLKIIGFRIVDLNNFDIPEQIKLFSNAKIIVSPTGSALMNIAFCSPGTKVFEISPKYKFEYESELKNRYEFISKFLKLNYMRIEADSIDAEKMNNKIKQKINPKVLFESNYYKNLILKLENINNIS